MMRIAAVTGHYPCPPRPNDGRAAYQTLRELAGCAEVRVFCPIPVYPSVLNFHKQGNRKCDMPFIPPSDVEANYFDYPALPLISRPFNGWLAAHAVLPHVRNFAPDVILSYFIYPDAFCALQIGKALSVPVVAGGVGSDVHSVRDPISALHTRTVLREVNGVFTVSDDLRKRAIAMDAFPEKTWAIHNGCDLSVFHVRNRLEARERLQIELGGEAVVYVGRLDLKKGLRELVSAAATLHPQRPDMRVYLVGEGPDRPVIERFIQAHDASKYVRTLPACAFNEVAIWMAAADVIALPSYMEGCPNVILEALACGRPVVATNVGGIPEVMNDVYGELVPPRNVPELARALAGVLDRNWDAEAISTHCSRSWRNVASELLEIFESLVAGRQAPVHAR